MAQQKLVLLIDVHEEELPEGNAYTELPDRLADVIHRTLPRGALELDAVYLLNSSPDTTKKISAMALNYHHYAVAARGERCKEEACEQHPTKNVLSFNDHQKRNNAPPGVN